MTNAPDQEGATTELAQHLPQGKYWAAKNVPDSNLRALIGGMARPINLTQQTLETLSRELNINTTELLIEEWEESVGLPDECFSNTGTLEQRRSSVIDRIRKQPIVTLAEMQAYVDRLFDDVTLRLGRVVFTFEYDFEMTFLGDVDEKFILVAEVPLDSPFFELEFEIDFTGGINSENLRCVLEKVVPSNVLVLVQGV